MMVSFQDRSEFKIRSLEVMASALSKRNHKIEKIIRRPQAAASERKAPSRRNDRRPFDRAVARLNHWNVATVTEG
jgi:hypothetical protein